MNQNSSFCSASAHVVFVAILFIFVLCAQPLFAWAETDDTRTTLSTSTSTAPAEQRGTLNLIQSGNYVPEPETKSAQKGSTWVSATKKTQLKSVILKRLKTPVTSGTTQTVDISSLSILYPMTAADRTTASAEISNCVSEALNSAPDYFWLTASYSYQAKQISGTWYIGTIKFNYAVDGSTAKSMKTQYENALKTAIKWIPANGTPLQKAKAAHDWLVKNCAYNPEVNSRLNSGDSNPSAWWKTKYNNTMPWSAFGALVGVKKNGSSWGSRQPVCEGYSLAYMSILAHVGIKADFVVNNSAGHGWNRVWLDSTDNKVYHVDVTHDDPLKNGKDQGSSYTPSTTWFMKSDSYCKANGSDHKTWTPSTPKCNNNNTTTVATYSGNASNPASYRDVDWSTPMVTSDGLTASNCTVTFDGLSAASFNTNKKSAYSGQNIKPTIAVTYKAANGASKKLTINADFSVTYPSDTISPGTKTITITGKGDYVGSSFTVTYLVRASLTNATITAPSSVTYTGSAQKLAPKSVVWKSGGRSITLKNGTDYTVTYPSNCTNVGTVKCKVTGKGAYSGVMEYSYTINKAPEIAIYWIVSKKSGENLYTSDKNEVNVLCNQRKTWINKGIMWYAPTKGKPVYRLVNKKTGDHHFTMDTNEVRVLTKVKKTWQADFGGKPMFYSGGSKAIWRLYNDSRYRASKPGTHKFTTFNAKLSGWKNEGVKLYCLRYGTATGK